MEQTNNTVQKPEGKGMGVAGFVISLVSLVLLGFIWITVMFSAALGGGYGLGIFWLLLCLAGTILSIMGRGKLGKTGGKKGLATTGMVLGIISTVLSLWMVIQIGQVQKMAGGFGDKFKDAMEKGMNQSMDSLTKAAEKSMDTTTVH